MSLRLARHLSAIALCGLPVLGIAQSLEQRVTRLEQILVGQSLSEMVLEVNRLRQEIRELRGALEVQQHQIEGLRTAPRQPPATSAGSVAAPGRAGEGGSPVPAVPVVPPSQPAAPPDLPRSEQPTATAKTGVAPATGSLRKAATPVVGEEQTYQQAFEQLQQGRYPQAQAEFEALLERYPAGFYADSARYWLGEVCYVQKDYSRALTEFERVLADYPESPKIPGALLKIGYIYDAQREPAKARETLQRLVDEYGSTTEARLAKNRIEKLPK